MSIYMILDSDKNLEYFPNNVPYNFKSHLMQPLNLEGKWSVALTEIDFNEKIQTSSLYVNCDICESIIVNGVWSNVLRKVNCDVKRQFTNSFNWIYYLPVIKPEIGEIEISIKDANGALATFISRDITVTLHFRKIGHY